MVVVTRDRTWRGSTFNVCLGGGSCWIDFTDAPRRVTNSSFDGVGCLSTPFTGVPEELWEALVGDLPEEGDTKKLGGQSAEKSRELMRKFFQGCDIPSNWLEDFRANGIL